MSHRVCNSFFYILSTSSILIHQILAFIWMFINWGKNWQAIVLWLSSEGGCLLSIQLHWSTAILFVSELSMAALQ